MYFIQLTFVMTLRHDGKCRFESYPVPLRGNVGWSAEEPRVPPFPHSPSPHYFPFSAPCAPALVFAFTLLFSSFVVLLRSREQRATSVGPSFRVKKTKTCQNLQPRDSIDGPRLFANDHDGLLSLRDVHPTWLVKSHSKLRTNGYVRPARKITSRVSDSRSPTPNYAPLLYRITNFGIMASGEETNMRSSSSN